MLENESALRLTVFLIVLILICAWEWKYPKRHLVLARTKRWPRNLAMVGMVTLLLRVLIPFTGVMAALFAQQHQIGLFHWLKLPEFLEILLSIILLDFLIYAQHFALHYIPFFWRFHKVHHTDQDVDVTTALRFHPIEIIFSLFIKAAAVIALGVPLIAVILFEMILSSMAMFNHGNIALPHKWDKWLRKVIVTPDMHRVHHSIYSRETNSNFGFNLALWDRLFRTYQAQPKDGHLKMFIGLNEYRHQDGISFLGLLSMPFKK